MENIRLEIVDFSNANLAIETQKTIFPKEDGTLNILASLDRDLFIKETGLEYLDDGVKYYLAYLGKEIVGISGLYRYVGYPEESWLAWFGVMPEYRHLGYATKILELSIEIVKKQGKKVFRLFTDIEEDKAAVQLYEKLGFKGEKYLTEELPYNCYIFSKSIDGNLIPWKERNLGLAHQYDLEKCDEEISKIYNLYKEKYLK